MRRPWLLLFLLVVAAALAGDKFFASRWLRAIALHPSSPGGCFVQSDVRLQTVLGETFKRGEPRLVPCDGIVNLGDATVAHCDCQETTAAQPMDAARAGSKGVDAAQAVLIAVADYESMSTLHDGGTPDGGMVEALQHLQHYTFTVAAGPQEFTVKLHDNRHDRGGAADYVIDAQTGAIRSREFWK